MAAAALLRSVASKMARAPPTTHHQALVDRGLHGVARSGPVGFVPPPPPTSNERMAAAARFRFLAATKLARAPPPPSHRLLHERGLRNSANNSCASGSTPPSSSKMDLCTVLAKTRAGVAYVTLFGSVIYLNCSLFPRLDRLEEKLKAQKGLTEDVSTNVPEAQIMQSSGHSKHPLAATGKGRKFDNLEEAHYHVRELEADIEALQTEITELKIALESAGSKGKRNV